jgi:hypothetical protein
MLVAWMFAAQLAAIEPTIEPDFASAKAMADRYEAVLTPKDSAALVAAQQRALETALGLCGPASAHHAPVTIVMLVGRDGMPISTWRKGESAFGLCMERELAALPLPVATGKPFHTSYELTFAP